MIREKPEFLSIEELWEGKSEKAKKWIEGAKEQIENLKEGEKR